MRRAILVFLTFGILPTTGGLRAFEASGMSWKNGGPTFTVCANGAPPQAADRIKEAGAKWNYGKFRFRFVEGCVDGKSPSWKDGVNYISFEDISRGGSDGETAAAYPKNEGTAVMLECDIRFNPTRKWYTKATGTPAADENDLFSVALHEFGHCLGLDHSKAAGSVMEDTLVRGRTRRELAPDDLSGRNAVYGAP